MGGGSRRPPTARRAPPRNPAARAPPAQRCASPRHRPAAWPSPHGEASNSARLRWARATAGPDAGGPASRGATRLSPPVSNPLDGSRRRSSPCDGSVAQHHPSRKKMACIVDGGFGRRPITFILIPGRRAVGRVGRAPAPARRRPGLSVARGGIEVLVESLTWPTSRRPSPARQRWRTSRGSSSRRCGDGARRISRRGRPARRR